MHRNFVPTIYAAKFPKTGNCINEQLKSGKFTRVWSLFRDTPFEPIINDCIQNGSFNVNMLSSYGKKDLPRD